MLNSRIKENVKIVLIVLGMMAMASICLFMMTRESDYVEAVDVNNQNNQTNSSLLTFDAGIEVSEDVLSHSSVLDVDDREKRLRTDIIFTADGCTLYNPTLQFLTETGSTQINFTLGFGTISHDRIKSSNDSNKTIVFNDMSNTRGLKFGFVIAPDFKNSPQTNQTIIVRFSGTLVDASGNNTYVTKDIYINLGWTASHGMELSQSVDIYRRNKGSETLTIETSIQNQIKPGTSGYTLPVKQTQIVVDVPTYAGITPSSVTVKAKKTTATNGRDETNVVFNNSNWNYNSSTGKITITVNNPGASSSIEYGNGADTYVITYTYPKAAYDGFLTAGTQLPNKVTGTMTLYSDKSTKTITKTVNDTFNLKGEFGVDLTAITKLGLYLNAINNVDIWRVTIGGTFSTSYENVSNIGGRRVEFGELKFHTDSATYSGFNSTTNKNCNPISEIYIDEKNFKENLGNSGYLKIYDDNCQHLLGQITTSTATDADGNYVFQIPTEYQESSHAIIVETSAPQQNLSKLEIGHVREIRGGTLTLKQAQDVTRTSSEIKVYTSKKEDPSNFTLDDKVLIGDDVEFMDTYTDAKLKVETSQLDASNSEFQDLEIKIILDNISSYSDAWSEPYFDIELPEYITAIDNNFHFGTNNAGNMEYDDVNGAITKTRDGKLHFIFKCKGNQAVSSEPPTSFSLKIKVKLNPYAPTSTQPITLNYINGAVKKYKTEGAWAYTGSSAYPYVPTGTKAGLATGEVNIINTPTLLCVSELSGYKDGEKINSIDNKDTAAEIARGSIVIPTMKLTLQNNHTVPVSNVSVIGRIPYTNNKYAIADTDLGTNINTTLSSKITGGSGKNFTIYYSDNLNATKDLDLASNNWVTNPTNMLNVRSYLIVINDTLAVGEKVEFKYEFAVPAERNYNKSLYANFGAYYTSDGIAKTVETSKIGLTTGARGTLNVTKTGELVNGGTTAKEGDIIKYTIKIQNNSEYPVENVELIDNIPEHTTFIVLNDDGTYLRDNIESYNETIGTINPHETKEYSFCVVVDEIPANTNIENTATVTADGLEPEPSNTSAIPAVTTLKEMKLDVTKRSDIAAGKTVKEGDLITYTITVRNIGGLVAKNIMIKDTVPEGTIYYDMETNTLIPSRKTVNSEVKETLAPDESFEFTFKVQVGRVSEGKTIRNTATVVGDNIEDTPSNTEGIPAEVTVPKLRLEKKSSLTEGQIIKEGDIITYTITVYNDGTMPAYDVEIKDKVPEYTTYYENDKKDKDKVDVGKVIPELKAGASESYSFTVIVEEIPENTVITNTATVKGENGPEVPSNTVGVNAEISVPELKLEKKSSIEDGKTIESGDIITYTIVATNTGDCIAHNVIITDNIPENTIYVEKLGDKYIKDESKRVITKEIEALNPGETATLTFHVMVGEISENIQISNTARVDANNYEGGAESNTVGISAKPKDSGKKGGDIPYTGKYSLIILSVVGIIAITVFGVYEYKTIKRRR